ncbi:MAG: SUMF1/EgtB/PvdO family nonheme iron enzyme, partial [Gemmataceae bacterium]|nr:SUMF1/EgtB/PvdO family nonheme iron enzyme [Gemmataceae bacterium]
SAAGESIAVEERDLPFKFDISEAWDRHLSQEEFGGDFVFSFMSQGQKYYRVTMTALRGTLRCESITFHGFENRPITREEWEEWVAGNVVGPAGPPPPTALAPFDAAQANLHQLAWTRHMGGPVTLTNSIGMKLRVIPPGEFLMDGNKVRITKPFRIGIHEVTVAQFRQFADEIGHKTEAESDGKGGFNRNWQQKPEYTWRHPEFASKDSQPAVFLCWNDAVQFCEWLSKKENKTYRLPTEAEWEWACRAGNMGVYHFGDDADQLNNYGWYGGNAGTSHPVGQKKPNSWGLFDLHGNAAEFCSDWSAPLPAGEQVDPKGPEQGEFRIVRGGGFHDAGAATSCSQRGNAAPKLAMMHFGLRVVLEESIAPGGKLPESADDVLPAMAGTWRAQIAHKVINGQPTKIRTEGYADISWVAGKRFLRMREQVGPAGANFVQVFSFDPKTGDFRNTHFDATGMVMGPTTSRWDSRTHTLTGTSQPDPAGLMVKNTRFIDADTMEWEAIVRDKSGKTLFETHAKLTRLAGPAKINEDEAPVPALAEMAVLHKLVGDWQTTRVQKAPVQSAKSRHTAAKVLGGRFVSFQELDLPSSEELFGIMTYDVPSEKYRLWNFAHSGQIQEFQGVWNDAAQRLTWHRIEPDGSALYRILDWRGPDEYKQTIQSRSKSGAILSELELTTTRQSKVADGWIPLFSGPKQPTWLGDPNLWKVNNDILTGVSSGTAFNTFFVTQEKFKDFEIKFQIQLTGEKGNTGLQIRSQLVDKDKFIVHGPQVDVGRGMWAHLYQEGPGGRVLSKADAAKVAPTIKPLGFNDLHVKCVGKRVTINFNGIEVNDVELPEMSDEGVLAWQIHRGEPMEVTVRNAYIRVLTDTTAKNE